MNAQCIAVAILGPLVGVLAILLGYNVPMARIRNRLRQRLAGLPAAISAAEANVKAARKLRPNKRRTQAEINSQIAERERELRVLEDERDRLQDHLDEEMRSEYGRVFSRGIRWPFAFILRHWVITLIVIITVIFGLLVGLPFFRALVSWFSSWSGVRGLPAVLTAVGILAVLLIAAIFTGYIIMQRRKNRAARAAAPRAPGTTAATRVPRRPTNWKMIWSSVMALVALAWALYGSFSIPAIRNWWIYEAASDPFWWWVVLIALITIGILPWIWSWAQRPLFYFLLAILGLAILIWAIPHLTKKVSESWIMKTGSPTTSYEVERLTVIAPPKGQEPSSPVFIPATHEAKLSHDEPVWLFAGTADDPIYLDPHKKSFIPYAREMRFESATSQPAEVRIHLVPKNRPAVAGPPRREHVVLKPGESHIAYRRDGHRFAFSADEAVFVSLNGGKPEFVGKYDIFDWPDHIEVKELKVTAHTETVRLEISYTPAW